MRRRIGRWVVCLSVGLCVSGWGGEAEAPKGGEAEVMLFPIVKGGKWGYMDREGKVEIEPQYDGAWDFSEGLACVQVGLFRGYIDAKNTMVIEPQFGWAGSFHDGVAAAFNKAKPWGDFLSFFPKLFGWCYINRTGAKVVGGWTARPPDFREGKGCTRRSCYGTNGKAIAHDAEEVGSFSGGMAAAMKGGVWGYLDSSMKWVIGPQFEEAGMFGDGMGPVAALAEGQTAPEKRDAAWRRTRKLRWGFVDKTGAMAIEPKFEDAWWFSEGLAPVKESGKWGYADKTGAMAASATHDYAWPFSEGRGRVMKDGKQGFVNAKGELAIDRKFDAAWEFSKGLARVIVGGKEGYIDGNGRYVWELSE